MCYSFESLIFIEVRLIGCSIVDNACQNVYDLPTSIPRGFSRERGLMYS